MRDLLVTEFGTDPFVAGKTINGCQWLVHVGRTAATAAATADRRYPARYRISQLEDIAGLGDGGRHAQKATCRTLHRRCSIPTCSAIRAMSDDPVSGAGKPVTVRLGGRRAPVERMRSKQKQQGARWFEGDGK